MRKPALFSDYLSLLRNHGRFLGFGFLMAFVSSTGQTYFIGIFGPQIQLLYDLSHTQWGSIYMVGTLASAALLPWTGQILDRVNLTSYTTVVLLGLVLACFTVSRVSSPAMLIFAIFVLRHFGQGLTSHTSQTSMARYMGLQRGKALAISSMGFSTGEAVLPVMAVFVIGAVGWQSTYQLTAVGVALFIPLILWALRGQSTRHQAFIESLAGESKQTENTQSLVVSKTRGEMLREGRFYLVLISVLVPSYIATAMFFHHLTLAQSKGWSELWITGNYWVYAMVTVVTSMGAGPMIDKFSAVKIMPFYLAPLLASMLILVPGDHPFWVLPYMVLLGINIGIYFTAAPALWTELYGPKYLGGIKSTITAFNVFAGALGPVTVGTMLDAGYSFEQVCITFAALCLVATVLLIVGLKLYKV